MSKMSLSKIGNDIVAGAKRHSPVIMVAMGTTGLVGSAVMAVSATPKAMQLIEEEKGRINREIYLEAEENGTRVEPIDHLHPLDVIKLTWKCYAPAVILGAASIGCIVGGMNVNLRRNAALATAYTLSETAFKEYREKVVDTVGEKKEKAVREEIHKDMITENPPTPQEVIVTDGGSVRCYDAWSGRYFLSDRNTLERVVNELNRKMIDSFGSYVSLNDFYYGIGLEGTTVGEDLGWRLDGDRKLIRIDFDTHLSPDGVPCLVVDFLTRPQYGYDLCI